MADVSGNGTNNGAVKSFPFRAFPIRPRVARQWRMSRRILRREGARIRLLLPRSWARGIRSSFPTATRTSGEVLCFVEAES